MDDSVSPLERLVAQSARWKRARNAVIEASIYPIDNEEYRKRLNELSEAEDALQKAIGDV